MCGQKNNSIGKNFCTFQGTFTHMSPERLKGEEHSFDSDIWSIGLTVAQCAIGEFPFDLKEFSIWEMLKNIESKEFNNMFEKFNLSSDLKKFLYSCMKYEPKDRETAKNLLESDFITKHSSDRPSIGRFINDDFIQKKKEEKKQKEKEKEISVNLTEKN